MKSAHDRRVSLYTHHRIHSSLKEKNLSTYEIRVHVRDHAHDCLHLAKGWPLKMRRNECVDAENDEDCRARGLLAAAVAVVAGGDIARVPAVAAGWFSWPMLLAAHIEGDAESRWYLFLCLRSWGF